MGFTLEQIKGILRPIKTAAISGGFV